MKPSPRVKPRKRIARGKPLRRSTARIKVRRPLGTVRREAKAAGDLTPEQWEAICRFYASHAGWGGHVICAYCLYPVDMAHAHQEHVVPVTHGGRYTASNVVVACYRCNNRKGTQTWEPSLRHPWLAPKKEA